MTVLEPDTVERFPRLLEPRALVPAEPAGAGGALPADGCAGTARAHGCSRSSTAHGWCASCGGCLTCEEFLSPFGVRSLSAGHAAEPYELRIDGQAFRVRIRARPRARQASSAATRTGAGPVWLPVNYLLIEALQRLRHYYGESLRVECPAGSGRKLTLLGGRRRAVPTPHRPLPAGPDGPSPDARPPPKLPGDPHFRDHVTFYEYFHGDTGEGLGARAQTGWTALVAKLLEQSRLWRS